MTTQAETRTIDPYPILDSTGHAQEWLESGRGIAVWVNQELGVSRGDMLTPGDSPHAPHWAYRLDRVIHNPAEVAFYRRLQILPRDWTDTRAGYHAAERALPADYERQGLAVRFKVTHTVERVAWRAYLDHDKRTGTTGDGTEFPAPYATRYRYAIVEWNAGPYEPIRDADGYLHVGVVSADGSVK